MMRNSMALALLGFLIASCAHRAPSTREPAQAENPTAGFSEPERWAQLKELSSRLNLSEAKLSLSSGGTSVYAVIEQDGRAIGAVIPENSATKLSGEVLSYTLARAFNISDIYQSAIYFPLKGSNLAAFRSMIPSTPQRNAAKEENRRNILARIAAHPEGIDAIFKKWDARPAAYDSLVSGGKLNSSHVLSGGSKPFAGFLKCDGPKPSRQTRVQMNGGTNDELVLAKQLSSMLLIDALTQQWDRFSGGNLQTTTVNGEVNFAAYDNGGTWSEPWTARNLGMVSRFDRDVASRILELNRFVNQGGNTFLGIKTEQELKAALGIENFPTAYGKLKSSLAAVAAHIQRHENCYFD